MEARHSLWPRLYAGALVLVGLGLLALAPLSHTLFSGEGLEQQAVAAVAARHLLDPMLGALWVLGAFLVTGGMFWLVRSLRWAALVSLALGAGLTAGAVTWGDRLIAQVPTIRPALAAELPVSANQLAELRGRLYAYAQREGLAYEDRSAAMARRQQRPDALWVQLKRDEVTVAVASDLLRPGQVSIQFYDPPGEVAGDVWKERLVADLAPAYPQMKVLPP